MEEPPASPRPAPPGTHTLRRTVGKAVAGAVAITLSALATMTIVLTAAEPSLEQLPLSIGRTGSPSTPATLAEIPDPITAGLEPVNYAPSTSPRSDLVKVPPPAWTTYQRVEAIMDAAASDCGLTAELLAALGATISDHGRRPHPQQANLLGPFAIPPATWAVVAVDADNDGTRNPGDLDDAALAVAVLLCDQHTDLTQPDDLATALTRLNQHPAFLPAVLGVYSTILADPREFRPPAILTIRQQPVPDPTAAQPTSAATAAATKAVTRLLASGVQSAPVDTPSAPHRTPVRITRSPAPSGEPSCIEATSSESDAVPSPSPTATPSATPSEDASGSPGCAPPGYEPTETESSSSRPTPTSSGEETP